MSGCGHNIIQFFGRIGRALKFTASNDDPFPRVCLLQFGPQIFKGPVIYLCFGFGQFLVLLGKP